MNNGNGIGASPHTPRVLLFTDLALELAGVTEHAFIAILKRIRQARQTPSVQVLATKNGDAHA